MSAINLCDASSMPRGRWQRTGLLVRFGLIGAATTLLDLGMFNVLIGPWVGFPLVTSHLLASAATVATSFLGQRNLVFAGRDGRLSGQALKFFLVTVTGVGLVQSIVLIGIAVLLEFAHSQWILFASVPATHWHMVQHNGAKTTAMVVGIAWNFFWFRNWVFRSDEA